MPVEDSMDPDAYKALEEKEEDAAQKVLAAALKKQNKRPTTTFGKIRKSPAKKGLAVNSKQKGAISKKSKSTELSSDVPQGGSAAYSSKPKENAMPEEEVAQQKKQVTKPSSQAVDDVASLDTGCSSQSNPNVKQGGKKRKMSAAALKQSKKEAKARRDDKKAGLDKKKKL